MVDEPPVPEQREPEDEELGRLESIEDRITDVEEELRLRTIEERLDSISGEDALSRRLQRDVKTFSHLYVAERLRHA